ncbi:bifunctional diaminohydroxyphosphoribosylaminopyrimidine deaminase/5-amino-6-(5-phosphoribosylamino)uracil reductase RibD [Nonlabens ulvanivorans]|uniref:bifunctional diaminohydroxyphosphoribosylaminopyrimidine deaminase/5-amino-6-(5-phosphoribosylamino)uracil reductase RibD n=1 Tax=Nonlabens ulvanivorans TaxID=906888 RepID=UPI002942397F|nr:bifunctional diaminohydroxyphosphoribosylaminopyrimidine deaminase/5-amino-6-(5-phosphoribosylamino)uracil reductase RibD [Nonlabens ulvanivorans]WOI24158.1 bifunctional diaminohydroxyphosphoribosylaminopyrimidine deaminase/5-amino-6-(5-phosphoribosylamino)uracil reductase RibD [Nonlabens ulvanivorans]
MTTEEKYMQRCLQLAQNGLGTTYPNPLVGSVIVSENDEIIGEGWHLKSGEPHAEVNAVRDAEKKGYDEDAFAKATIYVNLEPCSHTGKTPPCASMIVQKGFKKVVVGTLDPHDKVAGKGIATIEKAGIEVVVGVLENECNELNKRFFTFHRKQRPYIILKWAETSDGFITPETKNEQKPVWITNPYSRQLSHQLRAQENAILVGAKTVIDDNPSLTCRDWSGNNPTRVIPDSRNSITSDYQVMDDAAVTLKLELSSSDTLEILNSLYQNDIQSVIIEGGTTTIQSFIDAGLWDEAYQFMGTDVLFHQGLQAPVLSGDYSMLSRKMIANDVLKIYRKK